MPSIINASSSGSGGIVQTADASGVLQLQTAGTTAVTIDALQNVGIGIVPSGSYKLQVNGQINGTSVSITGANSGAIYVQDSNTAFNPQIQFIGTNRTFQLGTGNSASGFNNQFFIYDGTAAATRMIIDSSGNVGIGTSSPSYNLHVRNASGNSYIASQFGTGTIGLITAGANQVDIKAFNGTNDVLTFTTGASERMRIDSAGDVMIGGTTVSANAKLNVYQADSSQRVVHFENTRNVSGDENLRLVLGTNCNNTSSYQFIASTGGADKLYIYGNGNVVNANNSYGTLSDIKLKENIADATPKLADIMRLQVRNFNLKADPSHKQIGFIAQEFEQVFPAIVDESPNRGQDGAVLEETTKSIKTSVLIPILVKAIQEQQALITQLQADVAALKGATP